MSVDTQGVQDFEGGFAALLDTLDKLRALPVPTERDGLPGLIKWHDEVRKILSTSPELPDSEALTQFAEDVDRALSEVGGGSQAGPSEKQNPRDDGMLGWPQHFWAEIVTDATGGAYTFKEEYRLNATTWADLTGGRTGTCYEANDVEGIAVGTIIQIRIEYDATGALRYVFDYEPGLPAGTADKQMLAWDHDPGEWDLILPDGVWLDVDLATGMLKFIGPGPCCYGMAICGWLETDEHGLVRCWNNGVCVCGPCA
jgi:hypothetical protein